MATTEAPIVLINDQTRCDRASELIDESRMAKRPRRGSGESFFIPEIEGRYFPRFDAMDDDVAIRMLAARDLDRDRPVSDSEKCSPKRLSGMSTLSSTSRRSSPVSFMMGRSGVKCERRGSCTSQDSLFDAAFFVQPPDGVDCRRLSMIAGYNSQSNSAKSGLSYNEEPDVSQDQNDVNNIVPQKVGSCEDVSSACTDLRVARESLITSMLASLKSENEIQAWDRKMGLRRSHSKTMRSSSFTRKKLLRLMDHAVPPASSEPTKKKSLKGRKKISKDSALARKKLHQIPKHRQTCASTA